MPAWSPDGRFIAFTSYRVAELGSNPDVYVIAPDGSGGEVNVTRDPAWDGAPGWCSMP